MLYNRQIIFSLISTGSLLFQAALSSDIPEISETTLSEIPKVTNLAHFAEKCLSEDDLEQQEITSSTTVLLKPKSRSYRFARGLQSPGFKNFENFEPEISDNHFDIEKLGSSHFDAEIYGKKFDGEASNSDFEDEVCGNDSEDSLADSSVVSEVFLEDLGLRNSHPSTPSIMHSPAHRPQISPSSWIFHLKKSNPAETFLSDDEFGILDSEGETYDIENSIGKNILTAESGQEPSLMENRKSNVTGTSSVITTSFWTELPDFILDNVMEYCSDDELFQSRLTDKSFKRACDSFLNFITISTLQPLPLGHFSVFRKSSLSTTMMPFYRKQPQIRDTLTSLLPAIRKPWHLLSLIELSGCMDFVKLSIFSDAFITETLIPLLKLFPQNLPTQPSPLLLLGEALIKSKRFKLFDTVLLPELNHLSVQLFAEIPLPPNFNLVSPGFSALVLENQKVLGSTLHVAINHNLSQIVYHLIRIQPAIVQLKNHLGRTALLQIIFNLWKLQKAIPGPEHDENLEDWMDGITSKFISGESIQNEFLMNSRLSVELFLGIVGQIRENSQSPLEAAEFLGFNEEFEVYHVVRTAFYKHKATLLQELVTAQQYDLIISIGFHYGDLIQNHPEINPLHVAVEKINPTIIGLLLKFFPCIDVNQLTQSGLSAVGLAVSKKHFESLRVLLNDPRIDPNLHNISSPLIHSIEFCPIEIINLLLSHPSIEIHHQNIRLGKTVSPVERAVHLRKWPVLESLLRHPNQNYCQDYSTFAFFKEAEKRLNSEDHYDLLQLIREVILPTIPE